MDSLRGALPIRNGTLAACQFNSLLIMTTIRFLIQMVLPLFHWQEPKQLYKRQWIPGTQCRPHSATFNSLANGTVPSVALVLIWSMKLPSKTSQNFQLSEHHFLSTWRMISI